MRLPREPSNPERLKGFGYAEFDDVDSLLRALTLNEEVELHTAHTAAIHIIHCFIFRVDCVCVFVEPGEQTHSSRYRRSVQR